MTARLISEFTGTFILVFAGTGAIIANHFSGGAVTHPGIALVFGMAVIAVIYSVGEHSGAHINPAVTIGFAVSRRFLWKDVPPYLAAQYAGALTASGLWKLIFPYETGMGATLPTVGTAQSFLLETVLTFILMYVIIHVASGSREQGLMAGIAIGMTVAAEAMFAGPLTGASMNPARSLAPALFAGGAALETLWIYTAAPVIGAILAVILHKQMQFPDKK